jgi:hypothetical protein
MNTKGLHLLLLGATILLGCVGNEDTASKKEELKGLLSDYYVALARRDLPKMKEFTTPDFVMFEQGKIYNNETALKSVEQLGSFSVEFRFDSLNTHFDKANASAYYFRQAIFRVGDSTWAPLKFLESATFEKKSGHWRIRFLHSTSRQP